MNMMISSNKMFGMKMGTHTLIPTLWVSISAQIHWIWIWGARTITMKIDGDPFDLVKKYMHCIDTSVATTLPSPATPLPTLAR
jgi:hypothetical protein